MTEAIIAIVAALVAAGLTFALLRTLDRLRRKDAETEAQRILAQANQDAANRLRTAELEIKEKTLQQKAESEKESSKLREELRERERILDKREETLTQQADDVQKQERIVEATQRRLTEKVESFNRRNEELAKVLEMHRQTLHQIAGLSREEATRRLLTTLNEELAQETGQIILRHERQVAERCEALSREMLLTALHRYAAAHTAESTTSTVDIPSDDMKGRIIGREGRNIRAFEKRTGVDVIIDDTPGVVIVSGFDPVRREVARQALEKLIVDGRIHPSRIEEIVAETEKEIEKFIRRKGEEAAQEVNVQSLHERLIYMLGRLHFRTSYSQNVLRHSVECGFIAGMMAAELGLNQRKARRAGLLHDIGKAMTHEVEGSHAVIGAEFAKKFKEEPIIVNAIGSHHEDEPATSVIAHLVAAADALSGARPGARREMLESYVKRLENLEAICKSFKGVTESYAIQAGREVRVLVENETVSDNDAVMLSRDIAARIEAELTYPGQIQVTVIRESRAVATAK